MIDQPFSRIPSILSKRKRSNERGEMREINVKYLLKKEGKKEKRFE